MGELKKVAYYNVYDVKRHPNQTNPFAFKGSDPVEAGQAYARWQYGDKATATGAESPKVHDLRIEWGIDGTNCMAYAYLILQEYKEGQA